MEARGASDLVKTAWRWGRSRPYHLLPWIALGAAVILWPGRAAAPPPGLSEARVMDPAHFERAEPRRGRTARWPHQMTVLGWRDILWRTFWEVARDKLPSVSGGVTFYVLLALFPAIGAFVSLYGLAADVAAAERQLAEMATVFPTSVVQIVGEQMLRLAGQHPGRLSAAFLVSLLISVWSANAGMKALFEGLNVTYDEVEKRDFVRRTAITYASTFGALAFLASVATVLVATPVAMKALGFARFDAVWVPLRWAVVFAVTAGGFALVYRYGPSRRLAKWRWVAWGAVLGATAWLGGSLGFSWYVNNVAHFDATYGSLGAVVAFMTWVWFSVMSLLVGAEFNAEIEHQTAVDTTVGPEKPMGLRGAAMADTVGKPFRFRETVRYSAGVARRQGGNLWRQAGGLVRRRQILPGSAGEGDRRSRWRG